MSTDQLSLSPRNSQHSAVHYASCSCRADDACHFNAPIKQDLQLVSPEKAYKEKQL